MHCLLWLMYKLIVILIDKYCMLGEVINLEDPSRSSVDNVAKLLRLVDLQRLDVEPAVAAAVPHLDRLDLATPPSPPPLFLLRPLSLFL